MKRILIVEDEIITAQDIKSKFNTLGYTDIEIVIRANEVLAKIKEYKPNCILMDINLGGNKSGIDLIKEAKKKGYHKPHIYFTGQDDKITLQMAYKTEPYGYLLKPIRQNDLMATIENAFQRFDLEEKLREQHNLIKSILDTIPDSFALKDINYVYKIVNPAYCEFLGKKKEEIIGKTDYELLPAEEAEKYVTGDKVVMSGGQQQKEEWKVHGDAGTLWLKVVKSPVIDETGDCTGILGTVTDISNIKKAEQELKIKDSAIESSINAIVFTDLEGKITYVNNAFVKMWGYCPDECKNKYNLTCMHLCKNKTIRDKEILVSCQSCKVV